MAVEMMSGVLFGAAFGPHVNNLYKDGDPGRKMFADPLPDVALGSPGHESFSESLAAVA
jgi:hypothetical protein